MSPFVLQRAQILQLIPHQSRMCLWDAVLHYDAQQITLHSNTHRDAEHPLRSDGQLRALHLCEYGAQAMAVHGGVLAQASGGVAPPGMLVALRNIQLYCTRIDTFTAPLRCHAQVLAQSHTSQQYHFQIHAADTLLAEGRAAAVLQKPAT